jgi:hypothetical protein
MPTLPRVYDANWQKPTSICFWGDSVGDQCRLTLAVARKINPDVFWLQVEDPREELDTVEQSILKQLPRDRLWSVTAPEFAPRPEVAQFATWFYRSDLDANARLRGLADYMRLPILARDLLDDWSPSNPTRTIVIGRANRLAPFYEPEERGIRPFVEAINQYSTTPIFVFPSNRPPKNGRDADYLLRVTVTGVGDLRKTKVHCELGASPGTPGLFHSGRSWEVDSLLAELAH